MQLLHLSLTNFKNIAEANLEFSPKINCLLGNNGMGKSNLLDAIYYGDRMTKLVLIGRDMDREAIIRSLDSCLEKQ